MKRTILMALIAFLLPFNVLADTSQAEQAAVAAAESWLAMVDEGAYGASWQNSAELFKGAVGLEQWELTLQGVRGPLGEVIERSVDSKDYTTTVPGAPDGEYVIIKFAVSFTNKASGIETVTSMRDPDGQWRVAGYFIR